MSLVGNTNSSGSLAGASVTLQGSIGWKGERGYSAYEVAVQNGYVGSETDWLATLGTSSHFTEDSIIHTATSGQTTFALPSQYTSNSLIDVYVSGLRLTSSEYTVGTSNITLTNALTTGAKVEIIVLTMSTNNLPITNTITSSSTNETAAGTKSVYDLSVDIRGYLQNEVDTLNDSIEQLSNNVDAEKFDKANIQVLTGNKTNIAPGATETVDINYPTGFTQATTVIIGKMVSSNNNYYDTADENLTANGFPIIEMIALMSTGIRIWLKNTNNSATRTGYYKISLLKTT